MMTLAQSQQIMLMMLMIMRMALRRLQLWLRLFNSMRCVAIRLGLLASPRLDLCARPLAAQ